MSLYKMKIYKAETPDDLKSQFDDDFSALNVSSLESEIGYYAEEGKGKFFLKVTYVLIVP